MNNNVKIFIAFVIGAAAGSFISCKLLDKKYKKFADEEIESVKEMFNRKTQKKDEKVEPQVSSEKYNAVVDACGYKKESESKGGEEDMAENAKIYVIAPESFGEYGYETESLTYYSDKVLTYAANNEIIKNVDKVVGRNSLETFGEYEDDSVFVRNENMKKDFEILLDMRKYSDVVSRKPHLVTDGDDEQ